MSEKLTLPDGGWAVLRDPAAVPVRLRRPVERIMMSISRNSSAIAAATVDGDLNDPAVQARLAQQLDESTIDRFNELNDALIVARVESWSFDLPVALDSVLDLPHAAYSVLQTECSKRLVEMMPDFNDSDEPASPSNPSSV